MAGTSSSDTSNSATSNSATSNSANDEFLESKKRQYHYFQRILFWAGLACLICAFGVLWLIT